MKTLEEFLESVVRTEKLKKPALDGTHCVVFGRKIIHFGSKGNCQRFQWTLIGELAEMIATYRRERDGGE